MKNFYQIFFALMSMSIVAFFAFSMHQALYDIGYAAGVKAAEQAQTITVIAI